MRVSVRTMWYVENTLTHALINRELSNDNVVKWLFRQKKLNFNQKSEVNGELRSFLRLIIIFQFSKITNELMGVFDVLCSFFLPAVRIFASARRRHSRQPNPIPYRGRTFFRRLSTICCTLFRLNIH